MRFLFLYLLAEMGFDLLFRISDLEIWVSFDLGLVFICFCVFVYCAISNFNFTVLLHIFVPNKIFILARVINS